jgi:hypothetical protein
MNKEFLRMQMLSGIITESKYRQLLEDMEIVDRILDKISAKGKDSLSDEEKEYLDKYSKGDKDLKPPTSGATEVYVGEPYSELYKIENFPTMGRPEGLIFDCSTTDTECEDYPKYQELISNPKFKFIIDKIYKNETPRFETPKGKMFFHGIDFKGDFSSPTSEAYAQVSGDGFLYIVDSMDKWSDLSDGSTDLNSSNWQKLETWGIKDWKKL